VIPTEILVPNTAGSSGTLNLAVEDADPVSTAIPRDTDIVVIFNKDINQVAATVAANIVLRRTTAPAATVPIAAGNVHFDMGPKAIRLNGFGPLDISYIDYQVTVNTGITAVDGSVMAAAYVFTFQTDNF